MWVVLKRLKVQPFWLSVGVVLLASLFLTRTLFVPQLPVTHDLELHVARVANYYLALKQGQLPPRFAPNLNFGFGYPTFIFSYHYPYLVSTIIFILTDSIELSLNLFMVFSMMVGGLGVFLLAWLKLGSKPKQRAIQAVVISIAYLTAPYILLNVFVRGAVGEIGFWSLLPWVMLLLRSFPKANEFWYGLVFVPVLTAWLLSHQVLALLALPFLMIWLIVEIGSVRQIMTGPWKWLGWWLGLALLLVIFSWLPLSLEKKWVNLGYDNYQPHSYAEQFPPPTWLVYSPWEYSGLVDRSENGRFTRMIGWEFWLVAVVASWLVLRTKTKVTKVKFWLIAFWGNLFLMLPLSLFIWKAAPVLQYVQHPWRLIGFSVMAGIFLWLEWLVKQKSVSRLSWLINFLVILTALGVGVKWARPTATFSKPIEQWLEYHLTGDSYSELNPISFDRGENLAFPEKLYFLNNEQQLSPITPTNLLWTGSHMGYEFVATEPGQIIQKTAYYPGWKALINDLEVTIDWQQASWSGRITYPVSAGSNQVYVYFGERGTVREVANRLSLLGLGLWLVSLGVMLLGKLTHHFQNR